MTKVIKYASSFAGDKDAAARLREEVLRAGLKRKRRIVLDFTGVELATQSFMHALLAQVVRDAPECLEQIEFKGCNDDIRSLIEIVIDYAQEDFAPNSGLED